MEQLVLIFQCVWMCVCMCICVCVCACALDPWSSFQRKVLNHVMLIYMPYTQCSLYDWARGAERPIFFWMCPSPTGLYLLFIILVKHPLLCLKLCTTLLEYFIRKPAVTKCISADLWILLFLCFCSLQRKWMHRLEFLIMTKPLQLLTFSKSSLSLSGLHLHIPHISSTLDMFHWVESMI